MKNRYFFILFTITATLAVMSYTRNINSHALSVKEFEEQISVARVQLADIRDPGAYSEEHIKNAINIEYGNKFFIEKFSGFDEQRPIYIYCSNGTLTGDAAPMLEEAGFRNVYFLRGGINAWKDAGLKTVSDRSKSVSGSIHWITD